MKKPQLQPNGLYDQKELEAYIASCIGTTLIVQMGIIVALGITSLVLWDKLDKEKVKQK